MNNERPVALSFSNSWLPTLFLTLFLCAPSPLWPNCIQGNEFSTTNSSVRIWIPNSVPQLVKRSVRDGMGLWNAPTCNKTGYDFPRFVEGSPAEADLEISYQDGISSVLSPSTLSTVCGLITGDENRSGINLYSRFRTAGGLELNCPDTQLTLADLVAHELGHYLGLAESSCTDHIMGPMTYGVSDGAAMHFPIRKVQPGECSKAEELNFTKREVCSLYGCGSSNQEPLDDYQGDGNGTQAISGGCRWYCVQSNWGLSCDLHC